MITVAHTCSALLIAIENINTVCEIGLYTPQPDIVADSPTYMTTLTYDTSTYRWTFTNYKKANCTQFTKGTELAFSQNTIPDNIRTTNRIFTNIILLAVKHNIPKDKMPNTSRLLPEHIVCKIPQGNKKRRSKSQDPALKPLNSEITSNISLHKQNL